MFYDERTSSFHVSRIILVCILTLAGIWIATAAIWGLGIATAGIYGRGTQIKQVNSAENRTFQYNHFFNLYGDVKSETQQIGIINNSLQSTTDSAERTRLASVLLGVENICVSNTNQYNVDAAKVTTGALFRDHNLPQALPDSPSTNCTTATPPASPTR